MIVYVILLVSIIVFGIIFGKTNKKLYSIIMFIEFTFISGLRHYLIGTDTITYFYVFRSVLEYGYKIFNISRYEKGYILLNILVGKIVNNYTFFLCVCAFITNYFIFKFIRKYSENICVSFLLFFFCRFFFSEMNIIRQYIAIGIFLYSFKYIETRKFVKYLICIGIAMLFHYSVIFMIPVYYIYDIKLDVKKIIWMSLVTLIINMMFYSILIKITGVLGIYQEYIDKFYGSNKVGSMITFFMHFVIFIFLLYLSKNKEITKRDNFLYNCSFILILISFLSIRLSVLNRIIEYLSILMIVQIPNFIKYVTTSKKRFVLYIFVIICFMIYCSVITYFRPNWNTVYPYKFFWQ